MKKKVFYIMGVSGCGKSTIGQLLAKELNVPFFDGDDYHPPTNLKKMASGTPLNDDDRAEWLVTLNALARENIADGAVIACSALKASYRTILQSNLETRSVIIYLEGTFDEIHERLRARKNHFMPTALLQSQFDALEVPINAIRVPITLTPKQIVSQILSTEYQ